MPESLSTPGGLEDAQVTAVLGGLSSIASTLKVSKPVNSQTTGPLEISSLSNSHTSALLPALLEVVLKRPQTERVDIQP